MITPKPFTDTTKQACVWSFVAMILIIAFMISPLSNFSKTSATMKVIIIIILGYTIYLNVQQTKTTIDFNTKSEQFISQFNMNAKCSYVFTFCLGVLILFVIKSFF